MHPGIRDIAQKWLKDKEREESLGRILKFFIEFLREHSDFHLLNAVDPYWPDIVELPEGETVRSNFSELYAELVAWLGGYFDLRGLWDYALKQLDSAVRVAHDPKIKSSILWWTANIHRDRGEYEEAMELYSKALKIFKEIDDTQGIAAIHHELGYIHFLKGEYDRAMRRYKKSLKLKEKVNDIQGIAATYYAMANVHAMRKRYAHALILCTQALEMFREAGDTHGMASALVMFGQMTMEVGRKSEGLTYIMQGFVILKKLGAVDAIDALVTLKIAVSKVPESDYQKALSMLSKEERRIIEEALRG